VAFIFSQISCITTDTRTRQEERLTPYRSTGEIRVDDIRKEISKNPVRALDMIGTYREMYKVVDEDGRAEDLLALEKEASENLRNFLEKAISEERWDDAISYNRSLTCVDPVSEAGVSEQYLILAGAKKKLNDGNNLGAFLAAVQAHDLNPLSYDDSMLFLERAVTEKQRRTAAYFLAAAEKANSNGIIPREIREYAQGTDTVTEMLKGVATVIVDRGIRIERGRGFPDRVGGSAFFVDSSGLMITNYHVIESEVDPKYKGYSKMYIRMGDSTAPRFPARVVGWDKALDLALIKTEYKCEFVFSVVDRVMPQVGDTVLAIGSPVGLEKTVTSGIVSALSRRFLQVGDVIQIDAAVNHGNSGGPVVDNQGRLVGIVFAGIEYYQGLNFAIPAQRLAAALPAMIQGGKIGRAHV
jgi:S1-C subfamily serine protease